jgi:hypothetical protein
MYLVENGPFLKVRFEQREKYLEETEKFSMG